MAKAKQAPREKIHCRWCAEETPNWGTQECDGCWELRRRIERDPEMAQRMLTSLKEKKYGQIG